MTRSALAAALFAAVAMPALAQEFTAVQTIERIVTTENADGTIKAEFLPAERVLPGEDLYYSLTYTNGDSDAAENIRLVIPVPPEVVYSENSAITGGDNAAVAFSTDGGQSFAPRGELTVTQDGAPKPALSEDITHVRWVFAEPVAPGAEGSVGFRAIVR